MYFLVASDMLLGDIMLIPGMNIVAFAESSKPLDAFCKVMKQWNRCFVTACKRIHRHKFTFKTSSWKQLKFVVILEQNVSTSSKLRCDSDEPLMRQCFNCQASLFKCSENAWSFALNSKLSAIRSRACSPEMKSSPPQTGTWLYINTVVVLVIWGPCAKNFRGPCHGSFLRVLQNIVQFFVTSPCSLNRGTTFLQNW